MKKRIIIIGGVAGGASAAARLRRLNEENEIIIIERGAHISYANCGIPYYIGGEIKNRESLLINTPESLSKRFNLDVRVNSEVIKIIPETNKVIVKNALTSEEYEISYDELVISTGADAIKPKDTDFPGVFTAKDIPDADKIKKYISESNVKRSIVLGGGYIGLEIAEQLKHLNLDVTIIDRANFLLSLYDSEMSVLVHDVLEQNGVKVLTNRSYSSITKEENYLKVRLDDDSVLETDLVILALGVRPNTKIAKDAGILLGDSNGIKVDKNLRTNFKNIYAIGDCIEVTNLITENKSIIALAGPANQQGRIVADNICGINREYKATLGTNIIRIFDYAFGSTGISEKTAISQNYKYDKIYLFPGSHAGYFPGAEVLSIKVIFSDSGKILGAQIAGKDGVDKRIDVIATAIMAKLSINDLAYLQLSYAPPFGSAKDPINLIGMIAENILENRFKQAHFSDLETSEFLLDVRTNPEYNRGSIPNSIHIPLDQLRDNLSKLPKDKLITVFCQSGLRSYNACKILTNHGFNARNLSGAYRNWLNTSRSCS